MIGRSFNPAPVSIFAFNRADHLRKTLLALSSNDLADVTKATIYIDGPRTSADIAAIEKVLAVASLNWNFLSLTIRQRETNLGLARSIIAGVSEQIDAHERAIILEDDLVTSPHFLTFMNKGLDLYANEERVFSIHGYVYPVKEGLSETFFMRGADCWGWATWKRAWAHFNSDGAALLAELKQRKLTRSFDLDGAYPYTKMLENQVTGKNNSWAIRWHASAFLAGGLTLYPGQSLVQNIGLDGSGTHCSDDPGFTGAMTPKANWIHPNTIAEDPQARQAIRHHLLSINPSRWARIARSLHSFFLKKITSKL